MAKEGVVHGEIDWGSAEVVDGGLAVELTGEPSAEWVERVSAVIDRLRPPAGACEAIEVTRERVAVTGVAEGRESDVRHFLEGAVQQANADLAPDEGEDEDGGRSERDTHMTEAFRAFGENAEDPASGK